MRGLAAGSLVLVALIACSSFSGTPAGETTTPNDAGAGHVDSPDGAPTTTADATATFDASGETQLFADSFDDREADNVEGAWDPVGMGDEGTHLTIDDENAKDGKNALHESITPSGDVLTGPALYVDRKVQTHATYSVSFLTNNATRHANLIELFIDSITTPKKAGSVVVVSLGDGALEVGRQVQGGTNGNQYEELTAHGANTVALGAWHTVVIDIDVTQPKPPFTVTFDGAPLALPQGAQLDQVAYVGTVTLGCGVNYVEGGDQLDIWFDAVTLDAE